MGLATDSKMSIKFYLLAYLLVRITYGMKYLLISPTRDLSYIFSCADYFVSSFQATQSGSDYLECCNVFNSLFDLYHKNIDVIL